jgi:hypothetical protein
MNLVESIIEISKSQQQFRIDNDQNTSGIKKLRNDFEKQKALTNGDKVTIVKRIQQNENQISLLESKISEMKKNNKVSIKKEKVGKVQSNDEAKIEDSIERIQKYIDLRMKQVNESIEKIKTDGT